MNKKPNLTKPELSLGYLKRENSTGISAAVDKFNVIQRGEDVANASYYSLKDILPQISAKQPFTRDDYEYFRPGESIPKKYTSIILACDAIYIGNGIIRNVIDLMSDFACQGIHLSHTNPREQKFFNEWFNKVNGPERSERFLSCLYRHNMVVVKSSMAKLPKKYSLAHNRIQNISGVPSNKNPGLDADQIIPDEIEIDKDGKVYRRNIPLKYMFLHPACVDLASKAELGLLNPQYVYTPPTSLFNEEKQSTPLSKDHTSVYFYKKDDWQGKPIPFLFPLITHAVMIDKLNLADSAALDGATSRVRIFRLGDHKEGLFPSDGMVEKLYQILGSNVGGGSIDIIWSSDISLEESKVDVNSFLGSEKFEAHWRQMYTGLGIPPTLIGIGGGTTNNFMSLKTFVQRLEYGRAQLVHFWQQEIKKVQKAMGFSKPAMVEFDYMDLGDESSRNKLLLDMLDRNIISEERLQVITGHIPELENARIRREGKQRESKKRPAKTSPYHDPQFDISMKKVALQRGYISVEQSGIEIPKGTEGDETPFDVQMKVMQQKNAAGGGGPMPANKKVGSPGRPKNAKDTTKRKSREFSPRVKAAMNIWANEAHTKISELIKPVIFKSLGKTNLRQLTSEETEALEEVKFAILCTLSPFDDVNPQVVAKASFSNEENYFVYKSFVSEVAKELGRKLTLDELRQIQIISYFETLAE